jgi:hypothetical protein
VAWAGVDKPIDVTEEDQMEGRLLPEDTEDAMTEEEEEFPRAGVVVEVPHRDPLRHMIRERALVELLLCPLRVPAELEAREVEGLTNLVKRVSKTIGRKTRWPYSQRADREGDYASFQSHLPHLEFHFAVGLHHERATD